MSSASCGWGEDPGAPVCTGCTWEEQGEKRQCIRCRRPSGAVHQTHASPSLHEPSRATFPRRLMMQLSAVLQKESQQTITETRYLDHGHTRLELTPWIKWISAENDKMTKLLGRFLPIFGQIHPACCKQGTIQGGFKISGRGLAFGIVQLRKKFVPQTRRIKDFEPVAFRMCPTRPTVWRAAPTRLWPTN